MQHLGISSLRFVDSKVCGFSYSYEGFRVQGLEGKAAPSLIKTQSLRGRSINPKQGWKKRWETPKIKGRKGTTGRAESLSPPRNPKASHPKSSAQACSKCTDWHSETLIHLNSKPSGSGFRVSLHRIWSRASGTPGL